MNEMELRGEMVKHGFTMAKLAEAIGIGKKPCGISLREKVILNSLRSRKSALCLILTTTK